MLYLCQIQVARSPRLWKHVGSPFASLVVLDQSRSVSRSRAIGHRWWRDQITPNFASQHQCKYSVGHLDQDDGVTFFGADLSEVHHVSFVAQQHHRHLLLLFPSSILSGRLQKKREKKIDLQKNIICLNWLPQLSNIVEAGPAEKLWITFKIMGEPFLITFNFDTALPICLETDSDEPMKRYELIIEIDCSVLKVRLFNRVEAGKYIWKNWPKKLRYYAGKPELP